MTLPRAALAAALVLAVGPLPLALAQQEKASAPPPPPPPRRGPAPGFNYRSIEVGPDHKITFRIRAPRASEVSVLGDFGRAKMEKNGEGVWSATVGPLEPDYYTYHFDVDGVFTVDPRNPMIKPGLGSVDSMCLVPGPESEFEQTKHVPHGQLRTDWYNSKTLGDQRSLRVYTPPGYEKGSERYPVFYLLHGAGDNDEGWSTVGRAGFILDNLIAEKKAVPMIVVMPNGSLPRPSLPNGDAQGQNQGDRRAMMQAMQQRFTHELLDDVVPFVEANYRTLGGAEHRALAGLSMGGGQTLQVLTSHPDAFGYVGIWSAGIFGGSPGEFEESHAAFFKDAAKVNDSVKLLSISVGDKDFLFEGSKAIDALFTKHGIRHELHVSGGGHTWINWRHYLSELAPRLFR